MRLTKICIDSYGCLTDREIDLAKGLQVIAGPNEQGKSTLRHFVCDMLYGQKRGPNQRVYDASNELRSPWEGSGRYSGRLSYTLESGRDIEVHRNFDRDNETVRVFDHTDARDITSEFIMLRNREPTFAQQHLGMSKDVFISLATISHLTLDELGDKQALKAIRERLLALTDSEGGQSSAEGALNWLRERIAAIGQPAARTKPLPMARARLVDLQKEYEQALEMRSRVREVEEERLKLMEALSGLDQRKTELEGELQAVTAGDRKRRLERAVEITGRIEESTRICFELGAARDVPLEDMPEVRRTITLFNTASAQAARTQEELDATRKKLDLEMERAGIDSKLIVSEIDDDSDSRLEELASRIQRLSEKIDDSNEARERIDERLNDARASLAKLPDFGRLSADPVEWLSQLASSFDVARRVRDDEQASLDRIEGSLAQKGGDLEGPEEYFGEFEDFASVAREYDSQRRGCEEKLINLHRNMDSVQARGDDLRSRVPGFAIIAVLFLAGAVVSGGAGWQTGNSGIYIPGIISGLSVIVFGVLALLARQGARRAADALDDLEMDMNATQELDASQRHQLESIMDDAGCESLRELEGLFERYRQGRIERSVLDSQHVEQLEHLKEASERVTQMFARIRDTFLQAGQEIEGEKDVQGAAMRAIGRYQEYRDAKRRAGENKELIEREDRELKTLRTELDEVKTTELELSLKVRQLLREHNYEEEHKAATALQALRGYRLRSAQARQRHSQVQVLKDRLTALETQCAADQEAQASHDSALSAHLEEAGASNVEEYELKVEQAREYQERWKERGALEEQLEVLLDSESIDSLRAKVAEEGTAPVERSAPVDELMQKLEDLKVELDTRGKEEHALHISVTELASGARGVNEVEEERAATEQMVRTLELELQASGHAISVIEEVTRERHAKLAPRLANLASTYLKEITEGAYTELRVNRDLGLSVRVPQTNSMRENPENQLSKGTVDQIYLALRLAMVQSISQNGETIPMLLDDPFANYDDVRLERAMKLLARVSATHQILLFTCREDVVRAADAVKAPVLRL